MFLTCNLLIFGWFLVYVSNVNVVTWNRHHNFVFVKTKLNLNSMTDFLNSVCILIHPDPTPWTLAFSLHVLLKVLLSVSEVRCNSILQDSRRWAWWSDQERPTGNAKEDHQRTYKGNLFGQHIWYMDFIKTTCEYHKYLHLLIIGVAD